MNGVGGGGRIVTDCDRSRARFWFQGIPDPTWREDMDSVHGRGVCSIHDGDCRE